MLLPIRSKNPPESLPVLTILLIVANTLVFFLTSDGLVAHESVIQAWGLKGASFDWLRAFTSMFLHGDIFHLAGNMWFLYLFGFAVEGRLRSFKFGLLYLGAGLAGDLLHFALLGAAHPDIPSIGASGAIMGVMGSGLYLFPHGKVTFFMLFWYHVRTWDWPMWGVALMYVALDLFPALLSIEDGVGHFAHLGGVGAGFLIALAMRAQRDTEAASDAKAMLSDMKDLSVLSRPELAELHRSNPNDSAVVLNWVYRSMRDPRGVTDDCRAAFFQHLPKLLREAEEIGPVATCVGYFAMDAGAVAPRVLFEVASRLERNYDNAGALRLYEMLDRDPNASDADREAAFFRMAMISETAMGNVDRARHTYQTIVDRWPYGPFADQAKARLAHLAGRTTSA